MRTSRRGLPIVFALLGVVLLAGCSGEAGEPRPDRSVEGQADPARASVRVTSAALRGEAWQPLRKYVPDDHPLGVPLKAGRVRFMEGGRWIGSDGCNVEGGRFSLQSKAIAMTIRPFKTLVGCGHFSAYEALNGQTLSLNAAGTHMTVLDDAGRTVVEYSR